MEEQEKIAVVSKWLKGEIEEKELLSKVSEEDVAAYKRILETVDNWEPEGIQEAHLEFNKILETKKEASVRPLYLNQWVLRIAATVLVLAGFYFLYQNQGKEEFYAQNENLEITLPDGSTRVVLSPGASLSYRDFDKTSREVKLSGRAYFDVTEKGPFKVTFNEGTLEVLGTKFELDNSQPVIVAKCFSGKVAVNTGESKAAIVKGEMVSYRSNGWQKTEIDAKPPLWIEGAFEQFDDAELERVLEIVGTRYEIEFNVGAISLDRKFTGTIPLDDLDQACKLMFLPLNINYSIEKTEVVLTE